MQELGIDLIFAKTPQAKGRIERLWGTLQSRLPIEFAKRGIKTISEANRYLEEEYRKQFNDKFSITAERESIFVPVSGDTDIDSVLCVKHTRKTDAAGAFSFKNRCFQILDRGFPVISARREIKVLMNPRFGIRIEYQGKVYETVRYLKSQKKNASSKVPGKVIKAVKPHLPLRSVSKACKEIWHM